MVFNGLLPISASRSEPYAKCVIGFRKLDRIKPEVSAHPFVRLEAILSQNFGYHVTAARYRRFSRSGVLGNEGSGDNFRRVIKLGLILSSTSELGKSEGWILAKSSAALIVTKYPLRIYFKHW